jgi:hypothetical protein
MADEPEEMPANPFSALTEAAMSMHELFSSYQEAGFSDGQAMYLVACLMCGGPKEQK